MTIWENVAQANTPEGHPYSTVVAVYGRLVDIMSDVAHVAFEASYILDKPLHLRRELMARYAKKRSAGSAEFEKTILEGLHAAAMREWEWRKSTKTRCDGKPLVAAAVAA